jgi:hypothetical protein
LGKNTNFLGVDVKDSQFDRKISVLQSQRFHLIKPEEEIEENDYDFMKNYFEVRDKMFQQDQDKMWV